MSTEKRKIFFNKIKALSKKKFDNDLTTNFTNNDLMLEAATKIEQRIDENKEFEFRTNESLKLNGNHNEFNSDISHNIIEIIFKE